MIRILGLYVLPRAILLCALFGLLVTACGDDDASPTDNNNNGGKNTTFDGEVVFTPGWEGWWNVVITFRDCTTGNIVVVEDVVGLVCAGDTLRIATSGLLGDCDGVMDDTRLNAACAYRFDVGACDVDVMMGMEIERDGETLSGTGIWSLSIRGECATFYAPGCERFEIAGTLLGPVLGDCGSTTLMEQLSQRPLGLLSGGTNLGGDMHR